MKDTTTAQTLLKEIFMDCGLTDAILRSDVAFGVMSLKKLLL